MKVVVPTARPYEWCLRYTLPLLRKFVMDEDPQIVYMDGPPNTWGAAVKAALPKERQPVLLWLEDYAAVASFRSGVQHAAQLASRYDCVRLLPCPPGQQPSRYAGYSVIQPGTSYSASLQAAIWDSYWLRAFIEDGWSPWDFEVRGSYKLGHFRFNAICADSNIVSYANLVRRGQPQQEAIQEAKRAMETP